jgi:Myb/SANT-like DNA-binding domain
MATKQSRPKSKVIRLEDEISEAGPVPKEKKQMKWSPDETTRFLDKYREIKETPKEKKTGGASGLSSAGWEKVEKYMNESRPASVPIPYNNSHLQNKLSALVKDYEAYEYLAHKSGVGVDGQTGAFTANEELKEECKKTKSGCGKFFTKGLDDYDTLDYLFA